MHSVADDLRHASRTAVAQMDPLERITLAFELGDADLALYMSAHGVTARDARAVFAHARAVGRRRSVANPPTRP